jgi:hypothetical protein
MDTLAPNGQRLLVNGNEHGLIGPWLFRLWVISDRGSFRLNTSSAGSAELFAKNSGAYGKLVVREAAQGQRRLISLEDNERGGTTLVWQDRYHEVSIYLRGTGVPFEAMLDRLKLVALADSVAGITVRPALGAGARVVRMLAANFIPEICSLSVRVVGDVDLPAQPGLPVGGGELWREDIRDEGGRLAHRVLTIANATTLTQLIPFQVDDARLPSLAQSIDIRLN